VKGATGQRASAERHTKAGLGLMRGGRVAEAIEEFRLAVKVAPREGAHHLNLGFALMQAGQATEAVKCLERCLKLSPASAEARLYLGGALRALGKDAQAERALRAAVELAPKNEAIRLELSRLLYDLGRVDEAHAVLGESPLPPSPGRRLRLALTRITPIPRSSGSPPAASCSCGWGRATRSSGQKFLLSSPFAMAARGVDPFGTVARVSIAGSCATTRPRVLFQHETFRT